MIADTVISWSIIVGVAVQVGILGIGCVFNFMDGWTILAWASDRGYPSCVKRLLEYSNSSIDSKDNDGETSLLKAARRGYSEVVSLLLKAKADPMIGNKSGWRSLDVSVEKGHTSTVDVLLAGGANPNMPSTKEPAIVIAARGGYDKIIKSLASFGCDVNAKGKQMGRSALVVACIRNHPKCVEALIEAKADIESADSNGLTPLIWASVHGYHRLVKTLVLRNARIDAYDKTNRSALMWAAVQLKWETARYLIHKGGKMNNQDFEQSKSDINRTWTNSDPHLKHLHLLLRPDDISKELDSSS
ncbi:hypothetical protein AAMO2058_000384000 [Amorphochlora amoebiformis]